VYCSIWFWLHWKCPFRKAEPRVVERISILMTNRPQKTDRALAEIESELLKAEKAFVEASDRLKAAERDRQEALDTVNKHQSEIDKAIAELRQRSIAGSKWHVEPKETGNVLILEPDDMADEPVLKAVARRVG